MEIIQGLFFKWNINDNYINEINQLASDLNILPSIASVLYNRGYKNRKDALNFLFPMYDENFYNPNKMHNIEKGINRILNAIDKQEKILISGDYDVDGITSTSLLLYTLTEFKANINFFLPNRVKDGYGLTKKIVDQAIKNNYTLIITVDNGTSAYEAIEYAYQNNIDVIVTDHHQPKEELPKNAYCIINPHQDNCNYPFKELCGVGVAFKLSQILYKKLNKKIPNKIYELLLLGTIADIVPLLDENRYLVSHCLSIVNNNESSSIKMLKQNAAFKENQKITSTDIAFSIAPQLNSLGRMDDPRDGVLFLLEDNEEKLEKIAYKIFELNKKRKVNEQEIIKEIIAEIHLDKINPQDNGCIIKYNKNYPMGIIGLIAARVADTFAVPTCIFHESEDGSLKGSARSIPQINIFECISEINQELLITYGGHSGAAGISIKKENLKKFEEELSKIILKKIDKKDLIKKINIDGSLSLDDICDKLWNDLSLLEPFGAQNAVPIFNINNVYINNIILLKEKHIKAIIEKEKGTCSVIFFNRPEIYTLIKNIDKPISLIVKIIKNSWNNKERLELIGIDIKIN